MPRKRGRSLALQGSTPLANKVAFVGLAGMAAFIGWAAWKAYDATAPLAPLAGCGCGCRR